MDTLDPTEPVPFSPRTQLPTGCNYNGSPRLA